MILYLATVGCARPGAALFEQHPELEPGRTTWAAVLAADKRAPSGAGKALETLGDLVQRVIDHNPRVRGARAAWRARVEAVSPAGALPRPRLAYTWLPLPVETRVGPNEHRVTLTQPIPSPGGLVADHDAATARARQARHAYDRRVLETVAELKVVVSELRYLQLALGLVQASEAIAKQLVSAAGTRLDADHGTLFDISKARAQLAQLGYDRVRFKELAAATRGRLNALLDRAPNAPIPGLPEWPLADPVTDVTELYRRALKSEPRLLGLDQSIREGAAQVSGARARLWPDWTLGLSLMVNGPSASGGPDSGKEALGVTLGLSLPLWFGAEVGRVKAAEADLTRRVYDKKAHVRTLLADVEDAFFRLRNARRLVRLYDRTLLPDARKALADSEAWHKTGVGGFTDYLEARNTLHRFGLARERAVADAVQGEARLELLTGAPFVGGGAR